MADSKYNVNTEHTAINVKLFHLKLCIHG